MYFTIENILYLYSFIAIALIFYNIKYIFIKDREDYKHNSLVTKYIKENDETIALLKENKAISKKYYKNLIK